MDTEATPTVDLEQKYLSLCVKDVMLNKTGRHFVLWLLESCCLLNKDVFDKDPYINAKNSGHKAVGTFIVNRLLEDCPESYYKMILEHKYKESENGSC